MKKKLAILGSTGSIGTQALEVVQDNNHLFEVEVLTAYNNADLLIAQACQFVPKHVVIVNEKKYSLVKESLAKYPIAVHTGEAALNTIVTLPDIHIVLTAMVGYSGLIPTIESIKAGKKIALANKETLVVAGDLINRLKLQHKVDLYPVDSEHSAIFQCLEGEKHNMVEKIYLTASGGPFRGKDMAFLKSVTRAEALNHPNWCMGNKITIDSASLMNKGLEAIEAKWLFDLNPEQIDVIVHPQSIIHSIVQFEDGSMKAQMGLPDMRLPIQYALCYPQRVKSSFPRFNFANYPQLTFEQPDTKIFRNLALAIEALHKGGNVPCALNAANEIAVEAFLCNKIGFLQMPDIIETAAKKIPFIEHPSLEDYQATDTESRLYAKELVK